MGSAIQYLVRGVQDIGFPEGTVKGQSIEAETFIMDRNQQVTRILRVIHYLEVHPRGLTVKGLHEKLHSDGIEVTERTVRRDLNAIAGAHLPLENLKEHSGSFDEGLWRLKSIMPVNGRLQFTCQELLALFLARESMRGLQRSPLFAPINTFFEKLEKALGIQEQKELENLTGYLEFKPMATWISGVAQEVLDTVYEGCAERHILKVQYRSSSGTHKDEVKERILGPETLYFANGGMYLLAKDIEKNEFRTYSIARILRAEDLREAYEETGFSIEDYIKDSFGLLSEGMVCDVKIFVDNKIASYVSERRWHESQSIRRVHGGIELALRVRVNDELARWVLGLGDSATVIAPVDLRERLVSIANTISIKYKLSA